MGTGYFLHHARFPVEVPDITLLDLNPHCLDAASSRIARHRPTRVRANVLEPWPVGGPFSSIGLCYLLHCLPGAMADKAVLLDHARAALSDDGRIFGATILQGDAPRSGAARALMEIYNKKGVFSNRGDTEDGLKAALTARFAQVSVEMRGCVAVFTASGRPI